MSSRVWYDEKELTNLEIVKDQIDNYAKNWYNSIGFLWWDISIHPNIYEILSYSKKKWFVWINVITNSMIFDDYKKAERLVNSWVTRINISIHSHLVDIEDYLTKIKWWLSRKLLAIDNFNILFKNNILKSPLSINIVLNWANYKTIVESCLYFWKYKGINDIRINFIWPRFFDTPKDKKDLMLTYDDFLPYIKKLIYISINYNIRITFDSVPACIFYNIDNINYRVLIRKFLWEQYDHINEVSNLNKKIVFNWKEHKKNDLKIKTKNCKNCLYLESCEWIWKEYIEEYWENEFYSLK